MIKERRFPRIYFGWWMNLIMGFTSGFAGGITQMGASALFKPISSELGLTRAVTSVATSIARLEGGIQSPIAGVLVDKFGARWLVVGGTALVCTGLIWMYFVNSMWTYYLAWGLIISTGFNLGLTLTQDKVLTDWFISKRGLALGVRFAILGILSVVTLPIISWLIEAYGWRVACLSWGIFLIFTIPMSWYFVRSHRPEYYGLLPDGKPLEAAPGDDWEALVSKGVAYAASLEEREFTLTQAVKTRAFWVLVLGQCAMGVIYGVVNLHCIPMLTDMGIAPVMAAGMMSMMAFVNTPSRFLGGILSDRIKKDRQNLIMLASFIIQGLGITIFLLNKQIVMINLFLVLIGLGSGIYQPMQITIRGRYFGRKAYGSIQGASQLLASPVAILAPIYAGWVFDATGSYNNAYITLVVVAYAAAVLMLFLRPPSLESTSLDKLF